MRQGKSHGVGGGMSGVGSEGWGSINGDIQGSFSKTFGGGGKRGEGQTTHLKSQRLGGKSSLILCESEASLVYIYI
jgi:hypothetical protein